MDGGEQMAITNQGRVGKAMDLFRAGLAPFVERELFRRSREWRSARRRLIDVTPTR